MPNWVRPLAVHKTPRQPRSQDALTLPLRAGTLQALNRGRQKRFLAAVGFHFESRVHHVRRVEIIGGSSRDCVGIIVLNIAELLKLLSFIYEIGSRLRRYLGRQITDGK